MHQWGETNSVDEKDICRRNRETATKFVEINLCNFEITIKEIKNIKSEVNKLKKHRIYRRGSRRKISQYGEES